MLQARQIAFLFTPAFRLAVCLALIFVPVFFVRAQERDTARVKVLYPVNEIIVLRGFADNAEALARLDRVLEVTPPGDIRVLVITSAASPEGPLKRNLWLSRERGESLRQYILARRPDLAPVIEVRSVGEAWEELRALDSTVPQVNDERLLRAFPRFQLLLEEFLPGLRYARVDFAPRVYAIPSWADEAFLASVPQYTVGVPVFKARPAGPQKRTVVAVKTNLLFDAASMLNYAIEIPLGDRFSLCWEHYFPWWVLRNNRVCIQYLTLGGEARWWFAPKPVQESSRLLQRDRLVGHYLGVYGFLGKTDLQWDLIGCYQCDGIWSAGFTYGYSFPLTRHLNMELSASVGYARISYAHYNPSTDWQTLWRDYDDTGITHYFGPTKLQVSLVWPIQSTCVREGAVR